MSVVAEREWTAEQEEAIDRRDGELLLDAGAGSGKTSVLVERFARSVVEDGLDVDSILTITFTEKAAAELKERIRDRLHDCGAVEAARDTESAFISTIHGFCARLLRAHALSAGLDPMFSVLDELEAQRLADSAFDAALEHLASERPGGVELIAAYSTGALRGAALFTHADLRARGQTRPALPPLPPPPDIDTARDELQDAGAELARELGALPEPSAKVVQALERLERCDQVLAAADPEPAALDRLRLPGGNGAALSTQACERYSEVLTRFRQACEHARAVPVYALLGELLADFSQRYAERKRERSGLDFEDLELLARDLLVRDAELRERYRTRFSRIMVDELQDTNRVQLELIELLSEDNLFMVGDAQQSIYAFRHAEVELFEALGQQLAARDARARLQTNFRSRPEILSVINGAFAQDVAMGDRFTPLQPGRCASPVGEPLVELLVADKVGDPNSDDLAAAWRVAEARLLAARVAELIEVGSSPRDFVVLTRATTDLRVYERALEDLGIPTYVIGGRGYWAHPQVVDLVAYLRALANPRQEQELYTVLACPLVGVSLDALVLLAGAARERGRDPWWVLREEPELLGPLDSHDRERLAGFTEWFGAERAVTARLGVEELIDRALAISGYDLAMLALAGGERRLANVRKLMRLGREYEAEAGRDLRGFLDLVRARAAGYGAAVRESEAPVESEALDAVRLMTIHRAKGLEFPIVCVADLGRGPWRPSELLRLGREGNVGLQLARPGGEKRRPALDYDAIGEEQRKAEEREERRLFYVAMTRACERLILSGAAKHEEWPEVRGQAAITWIAPAVMAAGVEPALAGSEKEDAPVRGPGRPVGVQAAQRPAPAFTPPPEAAPLGAAAPITAAPAVAHLSYSSLGEYARCGYRFYMERVLGIPPVSRRSRPASGGGGLGAAERGIIVHALFERVDFRRPVAPDAAAVRAAAAGVEVSDAEAEEIAELVARFLDSDTCARLGRARAVRREERFSFLLGGTLITGALDVLAREGDGRLLVVDYKSDRLEGEDPISLVERQYATQRLIYGLAGLRTGAEAVEVMHVFLEAVERPVIATFARGDLEAMDSQLAALAGGVERKEFAVAPDPHRLLCEGCPAEGGLCSWPLELTRRETAGTLF